MMISALLFQKAQTWANKWSKFTEKQCLQNSE